MNNRRNYLHNAALLTGSGLVLRLLGMGLRVMVAASLGSEGMGLYQLILALYMVFVSFATAGIHVASARLAAQSLARGSGMAQTLRGLCGTALGFGTAAMAAQAVLAGPCARYLLHDIRAETALLILAPSLPFMAVSGAVRGCFLAARRVQPNITAQLVEQLVRMAVAAAGLRLLAQWGAGYGCAAVMLGNTVSEGISCGIMLLFAARTPEFAPRPGAPLHPYTARELYGILWPVEGSRLLASALQAAESSLIPYTLTLYTGSRTAAMAQYGALKGMALPLLFFPFSVLTALSGLLMPEITRAHTRGDTAAAPVGFLCWRGQGLCCWARRWQSLSTAMPWWVAMCRFWGWPRPSCIWKAWWTVYSRGWGSSWLPSGIRCWIRCSASQPSGLCCRSTAWQASCGL